MKRLRLLILLSVLGSLPAGAAGSLDCFHNLNELFRPRPVLRHDLDRETARTIMKDIAGYAVEHTPLVIEPALYQEIQRAAIQRARAIRSFFEDIYKNHSPKIFERYPQLKHVLATNPFFISEIVGSEMAHTIRWDYVQAMDWTVRQHPDGHYSVVILESDSGAIGGIYRLALVHQGVLAISDEYIHDIHDEFVDGRAHLEDIARYHHAMAREFGDGQVLLYTENDKERLLGPGRRSWLKQWFWDHEIKIVSTWNRLRGPYFLTYDDGSERYVLHDGIDHPVSSIMLRYYPAALDPSHKSYARIDAGYKTPEEQAHALPDFWNRFVMGGFRRWHQLNPLGIDAIVDKGTAAFIPEMIRFYLGEEPLLDNGGYVLFIGQDGKPDLPLLNEVFAHPADWVIKPRGSVGKGHGVVVGHQVSQEQWLATKALVLENPLDFVAQRYIEEIPITLEPGRSRSFEGRTILHVLGEPSTPGGSLFVGQGVYVRSASPGKLRNLSGSEGQTDPASIIPVLIPR